MNDDTTTSVSHCALRLSGDVLSAWRDIELRGATARRVDMHVGGCLACQMRLRAFETLGALLRAQPIPEPRPNALIELNARIVAEGGRRGRRQWRVTLPHPGSWRGLVALIAALLLAALCARLLTAGLHLPAGHPLPYVAPRSAPAFIAPAATYKEALWQAKTF